MLDFYRSSIGKKTVVAVTGVLMLLFLLGHMLGNLQVFEGAEKLNHYAELLRFEMGILWVIRLGLIAIVTLHVVATVQLTLHNRAARGTGYAKKQSQRSTLASRTMIASGLVMAGFIVYHILHLTTGTAHHELYERIGHANVFGRVVESFQNPLIAVAYIVAMTLLFFHLQHGIKSSAETLGVTHPRYLTLFRRGGPVLALIIVAGFMAVPLAIWLGLVS